MVVWVRIPSRPITYVSSVFFPTYANDLQSVAEFLGFQWSAPDASGLQSIVWRTEWECSRSEKVKQLSDVE